MSFEVLRLIFVVAPYRVEGSEFVAKNSHDPIWALQLRFYFFNLFLYIQSSWFAMLSALQRSVAGVSKGLLCFFMCPDNLTSRHELYVAGGWLQLCRPRLNQSRQLHLPLHNIK